MENRPSVTAIGTAYARAWHAMHDEPKVFDDFIAPLLFTPEEHEAFENNFIQYLQMVDPQLAATNPDKKTALDVVMQKQLGPITLSRSRYAEDRLTAFAPAQYVILGAGLDTFGYRHRNTELQVFEVDIPATQTLKQQRLARANITIPDNVHFVSLDFRTDNLQNALKTAGFDPHQRTFFSWLGVSYYLPRDVLFETLRTIGSLADTSELVFDYFDKTAFETATRSPMMQRMHATTQRLGEPLLTGLQPETLQADLAAAGLTLEENLAQEEIEARYFSDRQDNYHAATHTWFASARSRK